MLKKSVDMEMLRYLPPFNEQYIERAKYVATVRTKTHHKLRILPKNSFLVEMNDFVNLLIVLINVIRLIDYERSINMRMSLSII